MADLFGALAQSYPAASTLTGAYTVPALKRATIEVVICNQGGSAATVRLSQAVGGAADTAAQYLMRGAVIAAGDSKTTARFTAKAGDVIRVWSDTGAVSFNINGIEEDG